MRCPSCGLINPDSAQRCDCGYAFQSPSMKESDLAGRTMEQDQKCQKCLTNSGRPFTFYYGKTIATKSTKVDSKTTQTETTYHVAGSQQIVICSECIRQQTNKEKLSELRQGLISGTIGLGATFLLFSDILLKYISDDTLLKVVPAFLVIMIMFCSFNFIPNIFSSLRYYLSSNEYCEKVSLKEEIGSKIAISLREKTLKEQGFDRTWTPELYEFLRSGKVITIPY